jgi:Transposase DDE domain
MLLERMVESGTSCLRRLAQGRETLEIRFGRLIRNQQVTVERIIQGGSEETALAVAARHVLAIQDTSELNYRTSEGHRRGLGAIGKGVGRGILLHPMIGVDAATGECLGLIGGSLWTRAEPAAAKGKPAQKKHNRERPVSEKETRHWVETPQRAKHVLRAAAMVTMIADREADSFYLWALVPEPNVHVLGRIYHDRKLAEGGTLLTAARSWPVLGTRHVTIREREGRPEREAELELRAGSVTILRPVDAREPGLPGKVTLTLIELTELNPPDGAEPVTWRLLTTHSAADAATAWQIVDWYRMRWVIEQFFRILKKQGLQIEDSQVETAERLLKLVAIATRAAVIILQLTQARDGNSTLTAALVFSAAQIATLEAVNASYSAPAERRPNPHPPRSLPWASWIIARLGGWNGRPTARPPGPITYKNGLDALQTMAKGWALRDMYTP